MAGELGESQISALLETLPGIANVLRSPVADALVNMIRAGAGVGPFKYSEAEELIQYAVRRGLIGSTEGDNVLAEARGEARPKPAPKPPPPAPRGNPYRGSPQRIAAAQAARAAAQARAAEAAKVEAAEAAKAAKAQQKAAKAQATKSAKPKKAAPAKPAAKAKSKTVKAPARKKAAAPKRKR